MEVIRRVLPEKKIERIQMLNDQQTFASTYDAKSVRFDIYVQDDRQRRYDIEMQVVNEYNILQRARYYQSMNSIDAYEKGQDYREADDSYIIFFCLFDPLEQGLQKYTMHRHVDERPEIVLHDGSVNIFFDVRSLKQTVSPKMQQFLDVIAHRKIEDTDDFVVKLRQRIQMVKHDKKWRAEYMRLSLYEMDHRHELKEAREEGLNLGKEQGIIGTVQILKAMNLSNDEVIDKIMQQYHLTQEEAREYLAKS
ncbi:Rpn family recombination-promoting nuclease/putative transposase [Limosilactobacillus caecicola]|uniref:Rpn family recombination-promoting nuclease/putative transposase n=1 Tax=Limosilactobacillus caecicola TaxID=2941332 RepID=UPI0020422188|nr:Rpn family recombination-promoting nuclease/putative transposase [Limosilactobacillus caecicola]